MFCILNISCYLFTQKYDRTAHLQHQLLAYPIALRRGRVGHSPMLSETAFAAQFVKYPASSKNVRQLGTVFQHRPAIRQQTSCQQRQRTVFCTLHPYLAAQPFSAYLSRPSRPKKIPSAMLEEVPKPLLRYDQAVTRMGD